VEYILQARLVAVGAITVLDVDANDRVSDLRCLLRPNYDAGIARKVLVTGDPAECEPKPNAGFDIEPLFHLHGGEADVVAILKHGDFSAAVEADVEFARQAVERTLVQDVKMPFARVGPRVEKFLRIDAGRRRTRDVAYIVSARATRAKPEVGDCL